MLSVPLGYLRRQFNFSRDVRLFLFYNLLANVGWGVFALIFNLYLRELNLREDDMGAFSAAQTLAMAGGAATMGTSSIDSASGGRSSQVYRSFCWPRSGSPLPRRVRCSSFCLRSPASGSPTCLPRPCRSSSPGHGEMSGSSSPRSRSRPSLSLTFGSLLGASCRMCCPAPISRPIAGRWWRVPALPRSVLSRCSSWARRVGAVGCRTQPR